VVLSKEADRIISDARKKADSILEVAKEEVEKLL
jgi:vacuolar-type H+-ATPase subunit H